jgi:hypothetical protein
MLVPQWRIRRPVTQEVLKQGAKKGGEVDLTGSDARDLWPRYPLVISRGSNPQTSPGTIPHFAQQHAQSTSDR